MKLPPLYEPGKYEKNIYDLWEKGGAFEPKNRGDDENFSLVLPPPNANGDLHIGHALTVAIEDAVARYHRLKGRATLFVPGADHAGFETWVVYEKKLAAEGKSRFDYTREELYKQVWDFVQLNKDNFETQLRSLGASVDWSRFTFTLDNKVVATSYDTFQRMWQDGLVYRGNRIVNFCTFHGTSFSDIEVVHEEEKTKLWHIAYPLQDGSGEVVIATTRPETKLGQAALMVNPNDERYRHLIGKAVLQPLVPNSPITIIGDEHVEMDFGTGVVTVTPGHDPNDFEVAKRHHLPIVELITTEGKLSNNVPEQFRGLTVREAREKVADALDKAGYLRKVEDYTHSVGKCYKCGTDIEPLVREQWFVKMQPLAEKAIKALEAKEITFYPDSRRKQLIRYLAELKDWNISRQIAWGIPIPAFQNVDEPGDWIFDTRVTEETILKDGKTYRRDPDVFDTWFSSGQWPFVTLNYPDGEDFKNFYPLSLMETGFDILFQWVTRMLVLGLYITGEVPFKNVYLHGLVLDEHNQKMSKSKGNVVNPQRVIDEFGSDALRMGLLTGRRPGVNQGYHPSKVRSARNFGNKLWNIARFVEDTVGDQHELRAQPMPKTAADHWLLHELDVASRRIGKAMENYQLSEAYELAYHFVWHDFADWYIESSKSEPNPGLLAYGLESILKIMHPFAPFLSETIWQTLAWEQNSLLITQRWPEVPPADKTAYELFGELKAIIIESRRISTALGLKKPTLAYQSAPELASHAGLLKQMGRLGEIKEGAGQGLRLIDTRLTAWIEVDQKTASSYLDKLKNKRDDIQLVVNRLDARLANDSYTSNAPKEVVDQTRAQLEEEQARLQAAQNEIASFERATKDFA